jgi:hypothetical protein
MLNHPVMQTITGTTCPAAYPDNKEKYGIGSMTRNKRVAFTLNELVFGFVGSGPHKKCGRYKNIRKGTTSLERLRYSSEGDTVAYGW